MTIDPRQCLVIIGGFPDIHPFAILLGVERDTCTIGSRKLRRNVLIAVCAWRVAHFSNDTAAPNCLLAVAGPAILGVTILPSNAVSATSAMPFVPTAWHPLDCSWNSVGHAPVWGWACHGTMKPCSTMRNGEHQSGIRFTHYPGGACRSFSQVVHSRAPGRTRCSGFSKT